MRRSVEVDGTVLVVERPFSSAPRVLAQGQELPRDRFGRYKLQDASGAEHPVVPGFSYRHFSPQLSVGGRVFFTEAPLPRLAWLLLAPLAVFCVTGGAAGFVIGAIGTWFAAQQLRGSGRMPRRVAGALAVELLAVAVLLVLAAVVRRLF